MENNPPEKKINKIIKLYKKNKLKEALKEVEIIQNKYKSSATIFNIKGTINAKLKKFEIAIKNYKQAINLQSNNIESHNNLGIIYKETGNLEGAIESYNNAIEINPNNKEPYFNLGIAYKEIGNLENSIKNFVKAIKINPNYSQAFYNMAIVLKEYGNKESAIDCFKKAIKINPSYIGAYYQLGNIYFENKKKDLAIETYKNLLKIKPDHLRALHLLNALNGETTESAPNEYVSNLFDTFAKKFENTLVNQLDYKVPSIFERIISIEEKKVVNSIIDLGCGTGLVGEKISKCCNDLVGVDLSKSMLEIAESKNLYKKLHHSEISDFLEKNTLEYDYFIFADVFIYIGELSNIFRQIKNNSHNVTKLLFSTEHSLNENYQLQPSCRYSHSFNYIKQLTQKYDYKILFHEIINLRKDNNNTIKGGIYLLKYIKT